MKISNTKADDIELPSPRQRNPKRRASFTRMRSISAMLLLCEILLRAESSQELHSFQEQRRVAVSGVLNSTVEIVSTSPVIRSSSNVDVSKVLNPSDSTANPNAIYDVNIRLILPIDVDYVEIPIDSESRAIVKSRTTISLPSSIIWTRSFAWTAFIVSARCVFHSQIS